MTNEGMQRRSFLKGAMAAMGPMIVPSSVLGLGGTTSPNERVTMGCIGVGNRGSGNMHAFLGDPRVQVVAVCDVDRGHRDRARNAAKLPANGACNDFREIIGRSDIDTVSIASPDHWHGVMVVQAANAGKDIFCEKPLSLTLLEGRIMSDAVKRNRCVLQTGTWRRSRSGCRRACELVRNGRIGELKTIRCGVPAGFQVRHGDYGGIQQPRPVPEGFDYDLWLGPAPWAPYTPGRCHFNFRWIMDYSAGYITDWGAHYYDVAQWGNGTDLTGPVAIDGTGTWPEDGLYDAPIEHHIEFTYADGVKLIAFTSGEGSDYGTRFEGTEGWLYVESDKVLGEPQSALESHIGPDEIHLYESANHHRNFVDCVLTRAETAAPVEVAHRSASICHLGAIAALLQRPLRWDPDAERFIDDPAAERLLDRAKRSPWRM